MARCSLISSSRKTPRRASARSTNFSDAPGVSTLASRKPAHRAISSLELSSTWDSRVGAGALMSKACRPSSATVLAFRALSRATLTSRIISTTPSAGLVVAPAVPASTERAAASVSSESLLPLSRRPRVESQRVVHESVS